MFWLRPQRKDPHLEDRFPRLVAQPWPEYSYSNSLFRHSQDALVSTNTNSWSDPPTPLDTVGGTKLRTEGDKQLGEDVRVKCEANVPSSKRWNYHVHHERWSDHGSSDEKNYAQMNPTEAVTTALSRRVHRCFSFSFFFFSFSSRPSSCQNPQKIVGKLLLQKRTNFFCGNLTSGLSGQGVVRSVPLGDFAFMFFHFAIFFSFFCFSIFVCSEKKCFFFSFLL